MFGTSYIEAFVWVECRKKLYGGSKQKIEVLSSDEDEIRPEDEHVTRRMGDLLRASSQMKAKLAYYGTVSCHFCWKPQEFLI